MEMQSVLVTAHRTCSDEFESTWVESGRCMKTEENYVLLENQLDWEVLMAGLGSI